jgi:transglutaminase-like putative cysteine protease
LERNIETYVVKSDGSYAQTTEVVIRVETPQGIEDAGTQQISFISSNESIESVEAWTTQRDGTRIAVPPDSIRTREEDNAAGAAEFSDTRIKAIIFPQVAVGSRVSYKSASRVHTPPYQGEFNASFVFSPSVRIEHWELHISLPAARRLFIEMRGVTGGLQETVDGVSHYRFQHQRNTVNSPENGRVGMGDFGDFLRVSTLPDMVALGAAYHANARSKAAVTEDIRALATRLTADMTDDREKARALYHWVARNIRYVAVFLGNGRLVPHAAHEVLANRYGDCKDHAVLLEALLAAVGIESSPALINSGTTYTLPKVGAHGPINHVITYVPSMDLYLDSTSAFTSFGSLPFSDMDKPVVLTALGKMGRTPRTTATNNVSRVKVAMRMLPDGSIEGESRSSLTGVAEIASRAARFNARNSPEEDVVKELLFRFNETGIGSIANADPEALGRPYWVESKFRLDALSNVPGRGAIAMPVGLAPGYIAWIGSDKPLRRRLMPYACRSQTVEEKYIISLPPNVALDEIPRGVKYRDGAARYESSYRRAGRTVSVERKLVVQRDSHVCEPGENKRWDALHRVVQRDLRAQIFYR